MQRVNVTDWVRCPHCGNEDVELENWGVHNDYRPTVSCPDCGEGGYFD